MLGSEIKPWHYKMVSCLYARSSIELLGFLKSDFNLFSREVIARVRSGSLAATGDIWSIGRCSSGGKYRTSLLERPVSSPKSIIFATGWNTGHRTGEAIAVAFEYFRLSLIFSSLRDSTEWAVTGVRSMSMSGSLEFHRAGVTKTSSSVLFKPTDSKLGAPTKQLSAIRWMLVGIICRGLLALFLRLRLAFSVPRGSIVCFEELK